MIYLFTFFIGAVLTLSIGLALVRLYYNARKSELMHIIDKVTFALLAIPDREDEQFNLSLQDGIATIAAYVDADRIFIWKNQLIDGEPGYGAQMRWDKEVFEQSDCLPDHRYHYSQIPHWEAMFARGGCINGPIAKLQPDERLLLSDGVVSILILPVYMQEHFWGMVSFGDYRKERHFPNDQVNVLKTAALMMVSALNRLMQARQIHEANARVKKLLDTTPVSCFILNHERIITDCNIAALNFFHARDLPELRGRINDYFPQVQVGGADSLDLMNSRIDIAFYEGMMRFDWAFRVPESGEIIQANIILMRVDFERGQSVMTMYIQDMREQVRMTAELEKALDNANTASRAKGNFLSSMSHEMRTPISAIVGMTNIGRSATEIERKDYAFERIHAASEHLLAVISDILDMSKIEADKMVLVNAPFEPEHTFWQVYNILSFRMEEKNQHCQVKTDPRIPRYLIGDDHRLTQVLMNLLSNAVKFTPEGKHIRMEAHWVEQTIKEVQVRFEVHDEGIGISSEQQKRLFQSFVQAETSIDHRYGGSGLGLAISKHIVEMMGGEIWVESELDHGACFSFTVRFGIPDEEACAAISNSKKKFFEPDGIPNFAGKLILLAEDIKINQEIVHSMLESTNITIHCAENGEEAIRMFEERPDAYNLILMDIQMPMMDGHEATRCIRALPYQKAKTIPIIAMTANVFADDIDKCLAVGMNDHIGKPLNINAMFHIIKKYLEECT